MALGLRKKARIRGRLFFGFRWRGVLRVKQCSSLIESPSRLSPFFLHRNLSGHQRKREVVKHSSIVVWTSTHMTLLRMNQLLHTGRAAVETLYSNIVIAMCLRMVGSSCLYIYMCVCTILGWFLITSHVLHSECIDGLLMLRYCVVRARRGGRRVGYQSVAVALAFVCEVWSESLRHLHAVAR